MKHSPKLLTPLHMITIIGHYSYHSFCLFVVQHIHMAFLTPSQSLFVATFSGCHFVGSFLVRWGYRVLGERSTTTSLRTLLVGASMSYVSRAFKQHLHEACSVVVECMITVTGGSWRLDEPLLHAYYCEEGVLYVYQIMCIISTQKYIVHTFWLEGECQIM